MAKAKIKRPDQKIQEKAANHVKSIKALYETKTSKRREQLNELYDEVMNYYPKREADWDSILKVNFANQVEQTVTSRLTAKNPRFIVSLKDSAKAIAKMYYPATDESNPEFLAMVAQVEKWGESIQSYLNNLFDNHGYNAALRRAAKSLVRYGNCYGMIEYKVDSYANYEDGKINRRNADEYPALINVNWKDLFIDPRYPQVSDSAAVIRTSENVRKAELYSFDDLFNLDEIKDISHSVDSQSDHWNRESIYSLMITNAEGETSTLQTSTLVVDKFYGYFSEKDEIKDEKIYEI